MRISIIAIALLSTACGLGGGLLATPADVRESYLLEQIHREWTASVNDVVGQAYHWCGATTHVDSSAWPTHKRIDAYSGGRRGVRVTFDRLGYDPDHTTIDYGKPAVVTQRTTLPSHDYIYDLTDETEDGHFKQTDSVTLGRSRSVAITHSVTMDVTVENDTKISGSYAGVGLEDTLKTAFGYSNTEEEQRASSESKSVTREHEFDVTLPAGQVTRISIGAGKSTSTTPISINGVAVWQATIEMADNCVPATGGTFARWWQSDGRWLLSRDNVHVGPWLGYVDWHTNPPLVQTGALRETPITFPADPDTFADIWAGDDVDWQGMNGARIGASGSWLSHQPHGTAATLTAMASAGDRSVIVRGVQTLEYTDDLITTVSRVSPDDIDDLLQAGATLCAATSSTC